MIVLPRFLYWEKISEGTKKCSKKSNFPVPYYIYIYINIIENLLLDKISILKKIR